MCVCVQTSAADFAPMTIAMLPVSCACSTGWARGGDVSAWGGSVEECGIPGFERQMMIWFSRRRCG